jgi:hypothetical protein
MSEIAQGGPWPAALTSRPSVDEVPTFTRMQTPSDDDDRTQSSR